ncbi:MAG: alpha/beta fold hydrolase [Chthoniobacterales bacterium]
MPAPLQRYPDAARMQFGYIMVPENHANPGNGRTLQLAVVIVPALSSTPEPDPVFYIVGGPGGSATLSSSGFGIFGVLNTTRDIVYVDPRGAGFSEPNLFMRRNAAAIPRFASINRAWFAQRGIDVTAFNTAQIAEDYEDARVALGYGQINLFANSYGTFVAQELLRRHSASFRAVVMSGNSPATDPFLPTSLAIEKHGMDALIGDVSTNGPARRAFPHFRQRFYKLMDSLTTKPLKFRIKNLGTGRLEAVTIDGASFAETLTELLQVTQTIRYIPMLVEQLERRTAGPLVRRFFAPRSETDRDNPFGMYLSVLGTDFAAPGYVKATERGILGVKTKALIRAEGPGLFQLAQLIVAWKVPYNPGTTRTLPQSTVPTLLLNGMMDAQTPVSGGATIGAGITGSINYIYPRIGHAVGFVTGPDMDAAAAFINNPAQAPVFSLGRLKQKKFYVTNGATARTRMLDNWRDSIVDPPIRIPVPKDITEPQ